MEQARTAQLRSLVSDTDPITFARRQGQISTLNHLLGEPHVVRFLEDAGKDYTPGTRELEDRRDDAMPTLGQPIEE